MAENSITDEDNLDEDQDLDSTDDETLEEEENLDDTSDSDDDSEEDDDDGEGDDTEEEDDSEEEDEDDSQDSHFDDDLDEWAEKRNGKLPETDAERQALQDLRNEQREYGRKQQAKKDLEEGIEATKPAEDSSKKGKKADPLESRLDRVERELKERNELDARSNYFSREDVTDDEATAMGEILKEKVEKASDLKAKQEAFDYWTNPAHLGDWHDLAKIKLSKGTTSTTKTDEEAIAMAAAKKERERIAKESKANGSSRNARTTRLTEKTVDEERLERFKKWD